MNEDAQDRIDDLLEELSQANHDKREMLALLRDALAAIEELGGRVGELPRELPTAIEIRALLKRLGE